MSCDLEPATPGRVFRVGKGPDPWAYPDWAQAGEGGTFGNCWAEVLAGLAAIEGEDDGAVLSPGEVPTSWFTRRTIGEGTLTGRFADVAHGRSLAYLRTALAARLVHYGLDDLDGAAIRSSDGSSAWLARRREMHGAVPPQALRLRESDPPNPGRRPQLGGAPLSHVLLGRGT